jgi:hypothetical protein
MHGLALVRFRALPALAFAALLGAAGPAPSQPPQPPEPYTDTGEVEKKAVEPLFPSRAPYSPYADLRYPTRPYFGDTHLHTSFSMDAGAFGVRLSPGDAYRFGRGEQVTSSTGQPVKLARPLDFLVVADHSDGMGFFPLLLGGDATVLADPQGRKWYDMIQSGKGADAAIDIILNLGAGTISKAILPVPGTPAYRSAWDETIRAAEEANDPGRFSSATAGPGRAWSTRTPPRSPSAATTRAICGSGWPATRRRRADRCSRSRTTATSRTAGCSR